VYVREDKSILGDERLLELTRKLAQEPDLTAPQSVRKGEMMPLHRLLFWFVIKSVIPRGQGHNLADPIDMCYTDLLDRGEQIDLPAIMISHIVSITNTSKSHDIGYGFLVTSVFETLGIPLQKRVGFQVTDEIWSNILLGCGFTIKKSDGIVSEQGPKRPFGSGPGYVPSEAASSSTSTVEALVQNQLHLKEKIAEVKHALSEEKALNAQRHKDILRAFSAVTAKFALPSPSP